MSRTLEDYLNLITSEHRDKPVYIATLSIGLTLGVYMESLVNSMTQLFDVDLAVGDQLSIIGQWVGVSNQIAVPITGVYFAWDDVSSDGWDFGVWQGEFDPTSGIVTIPDDVYRQVIKGKIAANSWDGTTEGMYKVWAVAFPTLSIVVQDNEDMTMDVGISGPPLDTLTKALFVGGYIPLKPEGVRVDYYFTTVNAPLFGWDIESDSVGGWDEGAWGETS